MFVLQGWAEAMARRVFSKFTPPDTGHIGLDDCERRRLALKPDIFRRRPWLIGNCHCSIDRREGTRKENRLLPTRNRPRGSSSPAHQQHSRNLNASSGHPYARGRSTWAHDLRGKPAKPATQLEVDPVKCSIEAPAVPAQSTDWSDSAAVASPPSSVSRCVNSHRPTCVRSALTTIT